MFDISTDDFTSPSFFPKDLSTSTDPLIHGFISSNRVTDFISRLKLMIIQKLIPGLQKEGYFEDPAPTGEQPSTSRDPQPAPARPHPGQPPNAPERYYPSNEFPPRNPLEIGRSDLDPFPRNPFAPPPLFPSGGDGMYVGPNHPIFGIRDDAHARRGPWGGDGYLPPLGAPPGARFDPVGPFAEGPRPPRSPFPPGNGTRDPDNDEFMPPGMVSTHNAPSSAWFLIAWVTAGHVHVTRGSMSKKNGLAFVVYCLYYTCSEYLLCFAKSLQQRPSHGSQS